MCSELWKNLGIRRLPASFVHLYILWERVNFQLGVPKLAMKENNACHLVYEQELVSNIQSKLKCKCCYWLIFVSIIRLFMVTFHYPDPPLDRKKNGVSE